MKQNTKEEEAKAKPHPDAWEELRKGVHCQAIWGPEAITVMEHEDLTVECRYQKGYENYEKYWCEGSRHLSCSVLAKTTSSYISRSGLFLSENKTKRIINIIMKDIQEREEGTYWCGISTAGRDKHSPVVVKVKKALPITPTKAKETVSSTVKPGTTVRTKAPVTETLNKRGWSPTHTAAVISVGLLLLLICLFIVTCIWRLKHRRTQTQCNPTQLSEEQVEINYAEVKRATKTSRRLYDEPIYANMSANGSREQPPAGGDIEYGTQEQPPAGGDVEYGAIRC
ncbi:CMRF35-like molecule 5 isoform X3 [Brienomyrus brachyistius]|uniref:CMRF35-like molecule 5 isoform X3 n=1 Tax=Brienomyrus brachyistius TaxID=42636 RepID=UPI0020B1F5DE|nr:CMRF35-like molecule 5 isoform X3 [Brienomyrus brachyistius]